MLTSSLAPRQNQQHPTHADPLTHQGSNALAGSDQQNLRQNTGMHTSLSVPVQMGAMQLQPQPHLTAQMQQLQAQAQVRLHTIVLCMCKLFHVYVSVCVCMFVKTEAGGGNEVPLHTQQLQAQIFVNLILK